MRPPQKRWQQDRFVHGWWIVPTAIIGGVSLGLAVFAIVTAIQFFLA